ncbi:MAG: thiol-activated cytolysin family protein [Blautia sp.]|nr:thiol-activated cytolysin family protein [Lachnoclostridium sp.]MCM1212715.1 thiol-activated cytolysin family protein [Blautia sp.]
MEDKEFSQNGEEELQDIMEEMYKRECKKLKESKSRYKKFKRSQIWTGICFMCFLAVIAEITIEFFNFSRAGYIEKSEEQRLSYSQEYEQWQNRIFEDYCNRYREEELNAVLSGDGSPEDVNTYIAALKRQKLGQDVATLGKVSCITNTTGYELSEYIIAGDGNTVIFPGAVIKGNSLFQGTADYTLLPLERSAMSLTSNQPGGYSAQVENVNYQSVSEILNRCADKNEGQSAKEWNYYMQVIRSREELEANLGIQTPLNLAGMEFGASEKMELSSVAVVYRQTYYTVSVEPKRNAAEYFTNVTDLTVFGEYEPAYVSSVDYGRMVVVLIQGNMSEEELGAKVSACIQGVGIEAGLTNICTDTSLTWNIYQFGGEQKDVGMITDTSEKTSGLVEKWNEFWSGSESQDTVETRINDFISTDASAVNPVPIAYTLKYLSDNSYVPAMVILEREFEFE